MTRAIAHGGVRSREPAYLTKPLKRWVKVNARTLPETTDPDQRLRYLDIGTVVTGRLIRQAREMTFGQAPSRARRVVRNGDTIVSTVRTYLKAIYCVRSDEKNLVASTGFAVLTPTKDVDSDYLGYVVESSDFVDQITANSVGIAYPAISESTLGRLHVTMPLDVKEQARRALFLRHMDRRINRLIRAKRRLIALLEEQKQAIIQRAVTRGLDPNVRLKPSGIDWLGDVPEGWEVVRSKYVFREIDIRSATGEETHLSMSQRLGLVPHTALDERRLISESYAGAKLCERGDLVLNRLKAHLGVFALAREAGLVSADYTVLRFTRPITPEYCEFAVRTPACRVELRKKAKGIVEGFWRLYTDDLYNVVLPVPPLSEQRYIVAFLREQLQEMTAAIGRVAREIDLLREYRTRLIADVVTGKLDVRGVELPPLEDEGEELLDEDEIGEESAGQEEPDDAGDGA